MKIQDEIIGKDIMSESNINEEFEWLTIDICREYRRRADNLPSNNGQDTGERRKLRIELQERCHISPLEAINILNGVHCDLYVHRYDILSGKIAPPEGFEIHGNELRRIEKKKHPDKLIEEYEERISYLEEKARKADDFGFEEKD